MSRIDVCAVYQQSMPGCSMYALPGPSHIVRAYRQFGGTSLYSLCQVSYQEFRAWNVAVMGSPTQFYQAGDVVYLWPTPDTAERLLFETVGAALSLPISPAWRAEYERELCRRKEWAG